MKLFNMVLLMVLALALSITAAFAAETRTLDCNKIYTSILVVQDVLRSKGFVPNIKKTDEASYDFLMDADVKIDRHCVPETIHPTDPAYYTQNSTVPQTCQFYLNVTVGINNIVHVGDAKKAPDKKEEGGWLGNIGHRNHPPRQDFSNVVSYFETRESPNVYLNPNTDTKEIAQLAKDVDSLVSDISTEIIANYCDPRKAAPGPIPSPAKPLDPNAPVGPNTPAPAPVPGAVPGATPANPAAPAAPSVPAPSSTPVPGVKS